MKKNKYLIFDFGASNCRAIVADFDGKAFNMEITHRFENRPVFASDTLYWDILNLFEELKKGLSISLKKHPEIKSMGIDTWGADFSTIDGNGKMISNPVHYRDERRAKDAEKLFEIIPARQLYDMTGAWIIPLFDIFHLYSLKLQDSPELKNAKYFLSIADLFNYFLTSKPNNEITRLTTSAFYDQVNNRIEEKIFKKLDLPMDIFPGIIHPGNKIGDLSDEICKELSIEPLPVIAPASHDTASAVAGVPLKEFRKDWVYMSIGTWCSLGIENTEPIINDETFEAVYMNEAGVEGTNIFGKNFNGLWTIQQCMEKWRKEKGQDFSWKEIDKLYPKAKAFKAMIDVEAEELAKPQSNMPAVIAKICKESGQDIPEGIPETARCVYESMVLKTRLYFEKLQKFYGKKLQALNIVGGGSNNKLFCQWISDALGVPVTAGPAETTSVGNLLMQLKASGEIKDVDQGRTISFESSDVTTHEPRDTETWDTAYADYLGLPG